MNTPELATERLILREFTADDLEAVYQIFSDAEVNRFLPWFALKTRSDAEKFYETHLAGQYRRESGHSYAICLKDQVPIGYVNAAADDSHDLGYGLRKEFWRRGIVTEACGAVVRQLKREGVPYITATHDVNNPRSGGVMRRLGMRYCYSYQERWQPKDILVTFRLYQLNLDGREDRVYQKYWQLHHVHFVEKGL